MYYYYYYYYCSKYLSVAIPCGEHGRFVAVLGCTGGVVSIHVVILMGHTNEIGRKFRKSLTKTDEVPF